MRKRVRRQVKLKQKKNLIAISVTDVRQRHALEGKVRVIATRTDLTEAWVIGEYSTFREAKEVVDSATSIGVNYYVHSDSSRVLYTKKGVIDA